MYIIRVTLTILNLVPRISPCDISKLLPLFILEVDDMNKVEKCTKNLIIDYQYRKRKEIYKISVDILKSAFVNCNELVDGFKNFATSNDNKIVTKKLNKMKHSKNGLFLIFKKIKKKQKK